MKPFQLKYGSAYVVPALRDKKSVAEHARMDLGGVVVAVVLAHLALMVWVWYAQSQDDRVSFSTEHPQALMDAVVLLESEPVNAPETARHDEPEPQKSKATVSQQSSTPVATSAPRTQKPLERASMPIVPTPSQTQVAQVHTQSSQQAAPETKRKEAAAPAVAASSPPSNQVCSRMLAFNKRFTGILQSSATVTLRMVRSGSGAVRSAEVVASSGNVALDVFALSSARSARFESNGECDGRAFTLPVLFKAKS